MLSPRQRVRMIGSGLVMLRLWHCAPAVAGAVRALASDEERKQCQAAPASETILEAIVAPRTLSVSNWDTTSAVFTCSSSQ